MHISNKTGTAICNLTRWAEQNDNACMHVAAYYRHLLAQYKANRFARAA
jgi:hypothetical protein